MKAIKNITDAELSKMAKKRKNSHEKAPDYTEGYIDGANEMREKAVKENFSLRDKIIELKREIVKYRKELYKAMELVKKLAAKLNGNENKI